jgi:hypothetical protein
MQQQTIEFPQPIYNLYDTSRDGLPAIVVVNAALRDFPHRHLFVWYLSVIIQPVEVADQGMPTPEESEILNQVGDEIEDAVLDYRNALFLARETWNNSRQLIYLVHDPEIANTALQELIAREDQKREWEYMMKQDMEWEFAELFLELLEGGDTNT